WIRGAWAAGWVGADEQSRQSARLQCGRGEWACIPQPLFLGWRRIHALHGTRQHANAEHPVLQPCIRLPTACAAEGLSILGLATFWGADGGVGQLVDHGRRAYAWHARAPSLRRPNHARNL